MKKKNHLCFVTYQAGYEEEIIFNPKSKGIKQLKDVLSFDKNGECFVDMTFYDGYAIPIELKGFILEYPTVDDVKKSEKMMNEIHSYTGSDDFCQFEIALKYGKLKPYKEDRELLEETMILLSADIYNKIYPYIEDYTDVVRTIKALAKKFEKELMWAGGDVEERDYITELVKFEEREVETIKQSYQ